MIGVVEIPLRNRRGETIAQALADSECADWLSGWRWCLSRGYAVRRGETGRLFAMHRQIMGLEPGDGLEVDHINRDPLDNRRSNLRIGTHRQNGQNRVGVAGTSSRFRGVSWDKSRAKWMAYATLDGRFRFLGYFEDEFEAARASAAFRAEHMPFSADARQAA